jgi:hypothetical protein
MLFFGRKKKKWKDYQDSYMMLVVRFIKFKYIGVEDSE